MRYTQREKPKPPKRKPGKKYARPKRRLLVEGVELGDGRRHRCWLVVGPDYVEVRKYRSPLRFRLPLADAASRVAIGAQLRAVRVWSGRNAEE